jgi:hypothetical protein
VLGIDDHVAAFEPVTILVPQEPVRHFEARGDLAGLAVTRSCADRPFDSDNGP